MSENIIHLPGKIHINQIEDAEVVLGTSSLTESELDEIWAEVFVSTINFTIERTTFEADDGMRWSEWCGSRYNTGGYKVVKVSITDAKGHFVQYNGSNVLAADYIINGAAYSTL